MIGIYDYTVILTYLSVASTITGLWLAFNGRPFWAILCLMFCGFCDGFDGKIARTKKRTQKAINFGIQIDSLADMMAYGILPVAIGFGTGINQWYYLPIGIIFTLGALIRLAHFNVNEEEIAKTKAERSKTFIGMPTTSVALILPIIFALKNWVGIYFPLLYTTSLLIIAILFVIRLRFVDKPDTKKLIQWILIGILELVILIIVFRLWQATR